MKATSTQIHINTMWNVTHKINFKYSFVHWWNTEGLKCTFIYNSKLEGKDHNSGRLGKKETVASVNCLNNIYSYLLGTLLENLDDVN